MVWSQRCENQEDIDKNSFASSFSVTLTWNSYSLFTFFRSWTFVQKKVYSSITQVLYVFKTNIYYINTNEIPGELSHENLISSRVKITCYLHMWKYHLCYGNIINRAFHTKKLLKWNGLVFHRCLYDKIIEYYMAAWRYEISLLVLKKFFTHLLRSFLKYFSSLEEKFRISAQPCNILYIFYLIIH